MSLDYLCILFVLKKSDWQKSAGYQIMIWDNQMDFWSDML